MWQLDSLLIDPWLFGKESFVSLKILILFVLLVWPSRDLFEVIPVSILLKVAWLPKFNSVFSTYYYKRLFGTQSPWLSSSWSLRMIKFLSLFFIKDLVCSSNSYDFIKILKSLRFLMILSMSNSLTILPLPSSASLIN